MVGEVLEVENECKSLTEDGLKGNRKKNQVKGPAEKSFYRFRTNNLFLNKVFVQLELNKLFYSEHSLDFV